MTSSYVYDRATRELTIKLSADDTHYFGLWMASAYRHVSENIDLEQDWLMRRIQARHADTVAHRVREALFGRHPAIQTNQATQKET